MSATADLRGHSFVVAESGTDATRRLVELNANGATVRRWSVPDSALFVAHREGALRSSEFPMKPIGAEPLVALCDGAKTGARVEWRRIEGFAARPSRGSGLGRYIFGNGLNKLGQVILTEQNSVREDPVRVGRGPLAELGLNVFEQRALRI